MKNSPETLKKRNLKRKKIFAELKDTVPKYKERTCKDCKQLKPCRFSCSFNINSKPQYRTRCDNCHNFVARKRKKERREYYNLRSIKRNRLRKIKCVKYLGGKCITCGYSKCNRALTFHHKIRATKKYDICRIIDHSWDKLKNELDKCDLLCFNCHMEIEDKEIRDKHDL